MDENLQNIEDLFHSALDDIEDTPSKNVWEQVDKRLDKDTIISIKRKYTNVKRMVVLLLLSLLSFVLYEVNFVYTKKGLSKNNSIQKSKDKPDEITNRVVIEKDKTNPLIAIDTINNSYIKKQNVVIHDSTDTDKKQQIDLATTHPLQKQNFTNVISLEKDISKNQQILTAGQKNKIDTKRYYKIKITTAKTTEGEQSLLEDNGNRADNKIPLLQNLNTLPLASLKLNPNVFIDTKKLTQQIVVPKIKITDTSNNTVAKTVKKKDSKPSRFSVTPFFSPDIAWYRLQDDKVGSQPDNANELEKDEKHEFSSTYGALVDYKINKHWGLQSGVTFSNTNITVDPKTLYAQKDNTGSVKYRINTSSGYGYVLPTFSTSPSIGDSLYSFTSTHSLQYIGIPLAVTYGISKAKSKFSFTTITGVSANILTKAKLETTVEKGFDNSIETVDNLHGLKKIYFSGLAGIGVNYKLTNKISLAFAPTLRFALNSITKDAPVKSYPVSFGFTMGLKIGL